MMTGMYNWDYLRKAASALVAFTLLLAGCGGGTDVDDTTDTLELSGTVTVTGTALADLDDTAAIGTQDLEKWAVRVIDPTESVDSVEVEHDDTTFDGELAAETGDYLVEIELLPAADLSGGTADVTPVLLDLVVPLSTDYATVVDASVDFEGPAQASSLRAGSQAAGYTIRLEYTVTGVGSAHNLIELDWNTKMLRRDTNGNGMLDDETYYADSDRNGISDNQQQGMQDDMQGGADFRVTGGIEAIDLELNTIEVDGDTYVIVETTQIYGANSELITLTGLNTGQVVTVSGRRGKFGNLYATVIQAATE